MNFLNYTYYKIKKTAPRLLTDSKICIRHSLIFIKSQNTRNYICVGLIKGYRVYSTL